MFHSVKYSIVLPICSRACAIEENEEVTITGGQENEGGYIPTKKVTRYKSDGKSENLPKMKIERFNHACAQITSTDGNIVSSEIKVDYFFIQILQLYIVAGGRSRRSPISATETLVKDGGTAWQSAAQLPSARELIAGVGLDNGRFIVTGGEDVQAEELLTDVLMYDHTTDEWTSVGDLNTARADHAMALVPAVMEDHCIFEI